MTPKNARKRTPSPKDTASLSLAGLDFETALRAAMQTGKPPPAKAKKAKRKAKK